MTPRALAAGGVTLLIVAGAFAAHTRSASGEPPFPPPPPCRVAAGDAGVDCGPASAAIRNGGAWQVIDQGRCVDRTHLYFGAHTRDGEAPLSLLLDIPPAALAKGGDARVTDGQLAHASGATESLAGRAVIAPGGTSGAFTVRGHDSDGHPDGTKYAGGWTCQGGNPSREPTPHETHQAKVCTEKEPGGYRITCGPSSAVVLIDGRWQVVFPAEICGTGNYHFGDQQGLYGRYLWFHAESAYTNPAAAGKAVQGVNDGGMTVAGTHAAFFGRAIFQDVAQAAGAFDLNNRAKPSSPDRADYVGAWTCGTTSG